MPTPKMSVIHVLEKCRAVGTTALRNAGMHETRTQFFRQHPEAPLDAQRSRRRSRQLDDLFPVTGWLHSLHRITKNV